MEPAFRIPLGAQLHIPMTIEEHVPLAPLTTFKLGGEARYLVRADSLGSLKEALEFAHTRALRVLLLGGGSNMLIGEAGFDGLVIKLEFSGVVREGDTLIAGAGESWDALVERAVREGLWGLENLSGIPGSVGAAPVQNIGAYGAEVKDTLLWLEAYDTKEGATMRFTNAECEFGYRASRFKREAGRFVILRVAFALARAGTANASYKDLQGMEGASLMDVREKVLSVRGAKFPDLSVEGTAGSFFLNPIVDEKKAAALFAKYPELPHFATPQGIKLSLAWLLDRGLSLKGFAQGGARLFERQPLVIAARRDARAQDVMELAQKVSATVKENFDIELEPEVRIIS